VDFTTSDGTATVGSDYTSVTQTLTFADGDATDKTVTIPILDDALIEGDETVNLMLSNPTGGASLGTPSSAVLTIVDNEATSTEICTNGIDDNGDGLIDCNDPLCASASTCVTINGGGCNLGTASIPPLSVSAILFSILAVTAFVLRRRKS
jgi:hypothetical protein